MIESTDQNFDEGTVYELATAEAEEIKSKTSLRLARNGWSLFLIANSVAQEVTSGIGGKKHGILNA